MTAKAVTMNVQGPIAAITLSRPKQGNSVDLSLAQELRSAVAAVETDPDVRCVTLTGAGKLFCGGGDIACFAENTNVPAYLDELATTLHEAIAKLMRLRVPVVTLVNGPAAGAGLSLAICGDIVIAARSATFLAAYGAVGLTPDGGMSWLLPRLVGMRRAQQMIITNRLVDAEAALQMGLVSSVVDDDALAEIGRAEAERLAGMATSAIGGARELLLASYEGRFEDHLAREVHSIMAAGGTAESREGIAAFLERRKPDFSSVRA
ncbi:enoyl-CoA hydratase/isomerase family protein [Novosphingobium sp. 9U]|uniref:enoyl-CoA hydratase/isomerase family protein n=1 Tax=Novosphingobium sp. 9U TaxID=2653158 RepID=UPI0012F45F26|nr:enoyl-CoA hydratase-related protein [Novosphingobium sp. 9U]VWX54536.1 Enoyl-CoA hydratase [Novosphingobium sp. 9U]